MLSFWGVPRRLYPLLFQAGSRVAFKIEMVAALASNTALNACKCAAAAGRQWTCVMVLLCHHLKLTLPQCLTAANEQVCSSLLEGHPQDGVLEAGAGGLDGTHSEAARCFIFLCCPCSFGHFTCFA